MKTAALMIVLWASAVFAQDDATPKSPEDPAVAKAMAACGPEKTKFDVTITADAQPEAAPADEARVYIVGESPGNCTGLSCSLTTKVGLDGSWVGANRSPSYFSFSVAPGEHHLCARWQSVFRNRMIALAHFTAEAGKIYYFRVRAVRAADYGGYLDLDVINNDQGRFLVASYPLSVSHAKR